MQRSPWHEEVHTQAQNPGRILCDYGTPWQRLAEHDEAHLQGAVSQTRGRVLAATGTAQVYASVTRLHVLLLLPMRSHSKTQSKFLHVYTFAVAEHICVYYPCICVHTYAHDQLKRYKSSFNDFDGYSTLSRICACAYVCLILVVEKY